MSKSGLLVSESHLVLNQPSRGTRVSTHIQRELQYCDSFRFYVAFVTQDGIASLLQALQEIQLRSVRGRILVSQYLNFTPPLALRTLLKFPTFNVRIASDGAMHAKGYYFSRSREQVEHYLIGSSNWTARALSTNTELNIHVATSTNSALAREVGDDFDYQFDRSIQLTADVIDAYAITYDMARQALPRCSNLEPPIDLRCSDPATVLEPNRMQLAALESLAKLRDSGKSKALIISATGTGKTHLSAFDVQKAEAQRMLFVVHRENIARAAMATFRKVFGSAKTCGIYSGSDRQGDADFLFATVQTLSRAEHLQRFTPGTFDYIIVDESHRAGAASYARFLDHFNPRFLLGMTATPERTDGADIFRYFDYNIAYEIRLQAALEEEMLCPFHYFGVTDLTINGEVVEENTDFNRLTDSERVKRILEKTELYGCDDGIIRGLVFCSRVEEARALSHEFNKRGYRSLALDGESSETVRENAIRRLEAEQNASDKLDYLFTVDIFNEGVDIPQCNQIVLLRPTQSAIVFVQQLGRGLRQVEGKEKYLTVIDFIGNYNNNYMIPIALWGDRSYDKDRLRRLVVAGSEGLPGTSSINFDKISRERIFASINSASMQLLKDLQREFNSLRTRLGRMPMMNDFLVHDLRDPSAFADYSKSFYAFSRNVAPTEVAQISGTANEVLENYWRDSFTGTSLEEPLLLSYLLDSSVVKKSVIQDEYKKATGCMIPEGRLDSASRSLNMRYIRKTVNGSLIAVGETLGLNVLKNDTDCFYRAPQLDDLIKDKVFEAYLRDLVTYAQQTYLKNFDANKFLGGFVRYRKYRRADVFRILGANQNPVAQNVGGYLISPDLAWCPLFVTYKKETHIAATTQYEDAFLDRSTMDYFTKSNRNLQSPDVQFFLNLKGNQRVPLFVQKNNDEGIAFYYLGDVRPDASTFSEQKMADGKTPVVRMKILLDQPVEEGLYEYIIN